MSERKLGFFVQIKEGENFNRRNTLSISRIRIVSLTQIWAKKTVFVQALNIKYGQRDLSWKRGHG